MSASLRSRSGRLSRRPQPFPEEDKLFQGMSKPENRACRFRQSAGGTKRRQHTSSYSWPLRLFGKVRYWLTSDCMHPPPRLCPVSILHEKAWSSTQTEGLAESLSRENHSNQNGFELLHRFLLQSPIRT